MTQLRLAVRQIARHPGFGAMAVLVLAVGIGANSAMFGVINALLFRPVVGHRPQDLVGVYSRELVPEGRYRGFSYPNYRDLRDRNVTFSDLAAHTMAMVGLNEGEITRRGFAGIVSANFLRTLGVRPSLGRDFLPEEERPNSGATVAIVSDAWWKRHGADPGIAGRTLPINGRPFTIIGVTPPGFSGTTALVAPDLYVPLGAASWLLNDFTGARDRSLEDRSHHTLILVGRLAPGRTEASANQQLATVAAQLAEAYPAENKNYGLEIHALPRLAISTNPQDNTPLHALAALLLPMSGIVLLVACLNLANMHLARGSARRREMAIRLAIGGNRRRIVGQLLTEGALLAAAGGALGLALAWLSTRLLAASLGGRLPGLTLVVDTSLDARMLLATLAFSILATLLFGLFPAWKLARTDPVDGLKDGGTGSGEAIRGGWLSPRNFMVVGQLALSLTLLTVACLFLRGARNAAHADPGFALDDGLLFELDASLAGFDETRGRSRYLEALDRIRHLPGVASASYASIVPFGMFYDERRVRPVGGYPASALRARAGDAPSPTVGISQSDSDRGNARATDDDAVPAAYVITGSDYFKTVGLSILRGRDFDRLEEQDAHPAPAAVIDETLARQLWGDEDPLGRQFEWVERDARGETRTFQVIGVVGAVYQNLGDPHPGARFYVPLGRHYQSWLNLHVRPKEPGPRSAAALMASVRAELRRVDEHLPVLSMQTLRAFHDDGVVMWGHQTAVKLFGVFAILTLFLAAVGVYGVRAYLVSRRTREIGIRVALGAGKRQVLGQFLSEGLRLGGAGLGLGLLLALGAGRVLSSRLYQVGWADPFSLGTAGLLLGASTLLACWIPARRAARLEPMKALRYE